MPSSYKSSNGSVYGAVGGYVGGGEQVPSAPEFTVVPDFTYDDIDLPELIYMSTYLIKGSSPITWTTSAGSIDANTGVLTIPVDMPIGETSITVTATNEHGTDNVVFLVTVIEIVAPLFGTVPPFSYDDIDLPIVINMASYVLQGQPPLTWETDYGDIDETGLLTIPAGTPIGANTVNVTVTNIAGFDTVAVSVTITEFLAPVLDTVPPVTLVETELPAILDMTQYLLAGGAPITWSTNYGTIDSGTGELTIPEGTPIGLTNITVTATNVKGNDSTLVSVTIEEAPAHVEWLHDYTSGDIGDTAFTRASPDTYLDANGQYVEVGNDVPAFQDGLKIGGDLVLRSQPSNRDAGDGVGSWLHPVQTTSSLDAELGPWGTQAYLHVPNTNLETRVISIQHADMETTTEPYSICFLVKSAGWDLVRIEATDTAGLAGAFVSFSLLTGTVLYVESVGNTKWGGSIEALSDGWYKLNAWGASTAGDDAHVTAQLGFAGQSDTLEPTQVTGNDVDGILVGGGFVTTGAMGTPSYILETSTTITDKARTKVTASYDLTSHPGFESGIYENLSFQYVMRVQGWSAIPKSTRATNIEGDNSTYIRIIIRHDVFAADNRVFIYRRTSNGQDAAFVTRLNYKIQPGDELDIRYRYTTDTGATCWVIINGQIVVRNDTGAPGFIADDPMTVWHYSWGDNLSSHEYEVVQARLVNAALSDEEIEAWEPSSTRLYQNFATAQLGPFVHTRDSSATYTYDNDNKLMTVSADQPAWPGLLHQQCDGLQIEAESTNHIVYSEDLTQWVNTGTPITNSAITAPDGQATGTRAELRDGAFNRLALEKTLESVSEYDPIAFTHFYKFTDLGGPGGETTTQHNLGATWGDSRLTPTQLPQQWTRLDYASPPPGLVVTTPFTVSSDSKVGLAILDPADTPTPMDFWGIQQEVNGTDTPTSYIRTAGSAVTRAATNCVYDLRNHPAFTAGVDTSIGITGRICIRTNYRAPIVGTRYFFSIHDEQMTDANRMLCYIQPAQTTQSQIVMGTYPSSGPEASAVAIMNEDLVPRYWDIRFRVHAVSGTKLWVYNDAGELDAVMSDSNLPTADPLHMLSLGRDPKSGATTDGNLQFESIELIPDALTDQEIEGWV